MNAIGRVLRNVVSADFIVTMTVFSFAQSALVSTCQPDARPWTTSPTQVSGRSLPFKTSQDGSIQDMSAVANRSIGCTRGPGNRYSLKAQDMGMGLSERLSELGKSRHGQTANTIELILRWKAESLWRRYLTVRGRLRSSVSPRFRKKNPILLIRI